ncbi:unnamed protein product [Closterium sp. NIES-65]|nr:unnamed protein product [Closterium sp. NIES-65]
MENPQLKANAQMLETQQTRIAADVGVTSDRIVYKYVGYMHVSNGFAATLPAAGAAAAAAPGSGGSDAQLQQICLKAGEGMVVGVVDSGIWPEHPSFTDAAFPSSCPAGWSGKCDATSEFKCNNKLIGAWGFYKGFKEDTGGPDLSKDWLSPRDSYGHGTWCAGYVVCRARSVQGTCAAAGNRDVAMAGGRASGMAPAARMAVYKVLWYAEGSFFGVQADVEAAVNQAVADGVDVISLSLGGMDATDTYFHHMPYLAASLAGVLVAFAAGNGDAPGYDPSGYRMIENFYPFYLTVGASTIGRGGITLKAAALAGAARSNTSSVSTTPAATAYPSVADFSSTGPLRDPSTNATATLPTNSILKPDIVGRLRSPAQVMSAIMTTAKTTDTSGAAIDNGYGEAATLWEMGSGQVFPPKLLDPGLTYDARAAAYRNFLAGQSMKQAKKHFP